METHAKRLPAELNAPAWLLDRYQSRALIVGGLFTILLIIGAVITPHGYDHFLSAYLAGYVLWVGASLGCMALLMVNHLSAGKWGLIIRRVLESGAAQFPLMLILFIPIAIGMSHLFPWIPGSVRWMQQNSDAHTIMQHKEMLLNKTFFLIRVPIYFFIWWAFSTTLRRWSIERDRNPHGRDWQRILENLSGIGIVVYAITMTFAIVDWIMSLDAIWFSTIYGLIYLAGQGLTAFSICIITVLLLSQEEPMRTMLRKTEMHDIGKLLFAFVMLYAYLSFSQWLIIWSANMPDEANWYLHRLAGNWINLGRFLILFEFAVPFALLLSRRLKKQPAFMVPLCAFIIFVRMVDLYWMVEPNFISTERQITFNWMYIAAPLAIGGFWIFSFIRDLKSRPVLVAYDPQMEELLEPEHATA
ncbi:MAG: hypothetical protein DMG60_03935 [Acidobacteria bacterium]|nr:MAG: hypothetical protein DMG60_03935 [Acidobacteriota bacterium]